MNQEQFNQFIKAGAIQGPSRYAEYWFIYQNVPNDSFVLDLGAGRSALPMALQGKADVFTTEIDDECIKWQTRHGVASIKVKGSHLPFNKEMFDVVFSASAIEHFDPDNDLDIETIKEVHRVLRKDGLFILTMPVSNEYVKNRYAGKKHPPEKIYSEEEYKKRFLTLFTEVKRDFLKPEIGFTSLNGLLAVLKKK